MASPDLIFTLGGDTTAAIKAVDALTDYVDRVLDSIAGEDTALDIDTTAARKGVDLLGDAFGQSQKAAGESVDVQRKALAALIIDGKESSAAFDTIADQLRKSKQEADALASALKKVDGEILNIEEDADDNFLAKFFAAESVKQAGEALSGFSEKAIESRDAMLNLSAQTGATGAELELLKSQAERAFVDGVGESVGEAAKAIGTAKQLLGNFVDDSELPDIVTQAGAIAQVFDKDVNEVIGKSRTLLAQFGPSGLTGKEGLDLISLGMQQAGSAMDDLLDTTDEYSQLLVQTGFDAQESMGIFIEAVQAGARDTDKVADVIKETQIRVKAGDTDAALAEIASPVTATIQGIVRAGQQGQISIQEVLSRSAGAVEEAFDSGTISEQVRSQLQVALSGTPAEDLGSDIYERVFTADIDAQAIQQRAAEAGNIVRNALGPVTFFEKAQKEVELLAVKTGEFFAPFTAGAGTVMESLGQFAPAMTLIDDKFKIFDKFGGVFEGLGPKLLSLIPGFSVVGATGQASFLGIQVSATAAWAAATLGIGAAIAGLVYFFTQTETGREIIGDIGEGFSTAFTYVSSFASNAGEIIGALWDYAKAKLNPASWFGDDTEAEEAASKRLVAVITKSVQGAQNELAKGDLQEALTKATDVQAKVKLTADTDGLIKNYEAAQGRIEQIRQQIAQAKSSGNDSQVGALTEQLSKAEQQAQNLAGRLADDVPSAVAGVKTVVSETGELTSVYSVNIDKVKSFNDEQKKTYSSELLGQQKAYGDGLRAQASTLADQEKQLNALADRIAKGGATPELLKQYDELKGKIGESRKQLETTFKEGARLGLTTAESTATIAKAFKTTEEQAKKLLDVQKAQKQEAKDTAFNIANLAQAFTQVKAAAEASLQQQQGGLSEVERVKQLNPKEFEQELANAATEKAKRDLLDIRNANAAKIRELRKAGEAEQKEVLKNNQAEQKAKYYTDPNAPAAQSIADQRSAAESKRIADTRIALDIESARERTSALLKIQQEYDKKSAELDVQVLSQKFARSPEEDKELSRARIRLKNLEAQQEQERTEQQRRFAKEDLDRRLALEKEKSDALVSAMEVSFEEVQAAADRAPFSVTKLQEQLDARIDLMKNQGERERIAFVEGTTEFARTQEAIDLKIQAGTLDADTAYTELNRARTDIAQRLSTASDPIALAYQAAGRKQARAEADAYKEERRKIDAARLEGIEDRATRERDIAITQARVEYEEDLRLAGDNLDKQMLAFIKFQQAKLAAEKDYRKQSKDLEDTAKFGVEAIAEGIANAFGSGVDNVVGDARQKLADRIADMQELLDPARQEEIDKELQKLTDEESALFDSLRNREIGYEEYLDKLNELDEKRDELQKQKEEGQADRTRLFWAQISQGVADGFAQLQEQYQIRTDEAINKLTADFSAMTEKMNADTGTATLNWEQLWEGTQNVLTNSAGVAIGAAGQMIAAGENVFKALGKAALGTLLQTAEQIVLVNTGPIITAFLAWLGPLGLPAALAAIGVAMTALQVGKAAVQGKEKGGLVTGGEQLIRINERGEEYVVSAAPTAAYKGLLDHINVGGDPVDWLANRESPTIEAMIRAIVVDDLLPDVRSYVSESGQVIQERLTRYTERTMSERLERTVSRERERRMERVIERHNSKQQQPANDLTREVRGVREEVRALRNEFGSQYEEQHSVEIENVHRFDDFTGSWETHQERQRRRKLSRH